MKVSVGSRLHLALVDLGYATRRIFGGAGVALEAPKSIIEWKRGANDGAVAVDNAARVDDRCVSAILGAVERLRMTGHDINGRIILHKTPRQHVGLGVTTSVVLAALYAISRAERIELSTTEIQLLSGRGGASGVGLRAFFEGGVLVDAGHVRTPTRTFLPSGASPNSALPLFTLRVPFPQDWSIRLLLAHGVSWSGGDEVAFFNANTPVPDREVLQTLALLHHGVVPAIAEGNIAELAEALHALNHVGFKAREVASHGAAVRRVLDSLREFSGVAAGMSSMGPLVYAIGERRTLESSEFERRILPLVTDLGVTAVRWKGVPDGGENAA